MAHVRASFALAIVLAALLGCVFASPIQFQEESGILRQDAYPPLEYLGRYLDDRSNSYDLRPRIFGGDGRYLRQTRRGRGLDSLSGATFGESKRHAAPSYAKRNIDEIDRTAFDGFFKRNFEEIERDGWADDDDDGSFVKRLADYLANNRKRR